MIDDDGMRFLPQLKFFDDAVVHCMNSLDAVDSKDVSQKCEFFTVLSRSIPLFPKVNNFLYIILRQSDTNYCEIRYGRYYHHNQHRHDRQHRRWHHHHRRRRRRHLI